MSPPARQDWELVCPHHHRLYAIFPAHPFCRPPQAGKAAEGWPATCFLRGLRVSAIPAAVRITD
jgi:hypothetical protein